MKNILIIPLVFSLISCASTESEPNQNNSLEASEASVEEGETSADDAVSDVVDEVDEVGGPLLIMPGNSIGAIGLGMTYAQMREAFGEIPQAIGFRKLYIVPYPEFGLEVVYASGSETGLSDDAWVMAVGTTGTEGFTGDVVPGMTRSEVEISYGIAPEEARGHAFYPSGVSVKYEDDRVVRVGIFKPYEIRLVPPPMAQAEILGGAQ